VIRWAYVLSAWWSALDPLVLKWKSIFSQAQFMTSFSDSFCLLHCLYQLCPYQRWNSVYWL